MMRDENLSCEMGLFSNDDRTLPTDYYCSQTVLPTPKSVTENTENDAATIFLPLLVLVKKGCVAMKAKVERIGIPSDQKRTLFRKDFCANARTCAPQPSHAHSSHRAEIRAYECCINRGDYLRHNEIPEQGQTNRKRAGAKKIIHHFLV